MPCFRMGSLSCFSRVRLFAILWTAALQAPPSMGFPRQKYWSGLPSPPPGDLPDPGIEHGPPALQADSSLSEPPGKTDLKPVPLSTIHMTFGKCSIHFIPPSIQLFTCYHKSWLYMWTSPDGQYQNQTDYILCCWRWRSSIQSAKIRPGADCGSLHELLIAKYRLKLKKVGKPLGHSSIISGNGK